MYTAPVRMRDSVLPRVISTYDATSRISNPT